MWRIRGAFRRKALLAHPDKGGNEERCVWVIQCGKPGPVVLFGLLVILSQAIMALIRDLCCQSAFCLRCLCLDRWTTQKDASISKGILCSGWFSRRTGDSLCHSAQEMFHAVYSAFETLSDPKAKAVYDFWLQKPLSFLDEDQWTSLWCLSCYNLGLFWVIEELLTMTALRDVGSGKEPEGLGGKSRTLGSRKASRLGQEHKWHVICVLMFIYVFLMFYFSQFVQPADLALM